MVTCTGHIGIHEGADGRTYVRCTDVHDVMAIKPNFLTSMGYHIFLSVVLRARAPSARAELRYKANQLGTKLRLHCRHDRHCFRFGELSSVATGEETHELLHRWPR